MIKNKHFLLVLYFKKFSWHLHYFITCLSFKSCLLCSMQPCAFFPAGMFLTLTSRVYQPLQDLKDRRANSLSSQVSKKINHALWEPLFPEESKKRNPWGCSAGQQLSLRGHDLSPGSGYRHGWAAAEKTRPGACQLPRSSANRNVGNVSSTTHKWPPKLEEITSAPHILTGDSKGGRKRHDINIG